MIYGLGESLRYPVGFLNRLVQSFEYADRYGMEIRLYRFPILDCFSGDKSWTVEYLGEATVGADLYSNIVVWAMTHPERKALLHRRLYLHPSPVGCPGIVMLHDSVKKLNIVSVLNESFPQIAH